MVDFGDIEESSKSSDSDVEENPEFAPASPGNNKYSLNNNEFGSGQKRKSTIHVMTEGSEIRKNLIQVDNFDGSEHSRKEMSFSS